MISMLILVFIFGAIIGSFLNVVILRLPDKKSLGGRSHCPKCNHILKAIDLVPILSYIILGGKCRYCRKKISPRYVLVEFITGALFILAYYFFPPMSDPIQFVRILFIVSVLIVVFAIDYENYLILDNFIFPASFALLALNFADDLLQTHTITNSLVLNGLFSGAAVFLFFGGIYYISKGKWMGFGDVKYTWFLGLATPYPYIVENIFLAFTIGAVVGILLLIFGGKKLHSEIPFGTFLSVSTAIVLFFGPPILDYYLRLIGLK